ncbi:exosome complex component CSL4-like isoform X2 [Gigantopelta aegis]|uniref:exosome complex component CSL4-like isoform X2 n=1 Tax=Gigantopelta aegis TaxID=1735272 RepID=UPI001B88DF31|nr:exosome complex component CSL4-like isoform X2 [Gigantopelta aegis]
MAAPSACVPGQRLCRLDDDLLPGDGTYIRNGFVYSSLAGFLRTGQHQGKKTLEVYTVTLKNMVPSVDALVTGRITNVNPRFCKCAILSIGKTPLRETFRGMIRKEDVRATEKDKVEMYKCFRPGDIVIAKVLSLGDAHSYLLSTAENELGVVVANSEAGVPMVPISWCKMQCPKTLQEEHRKVAKVQSCYTETVPA